MDLSPEKQGSPPASDAHAALQDLPRLIERMHRRFLDVLRLELEHLGTTDISPVQAMMIGNIGDGEISVRDLIERGSYLGSNASYNLKQLVDCGYVDRKASSRDRRSARLKLTGKGRDLLAQIAALQENWAGSLLEGDGQNAMILTWQTLRQLERCWSDSLHFSASKVNSMLGVLS